MMPISAHLLEQRNRGRVFLQSADPHDQVGIDSCMLEHPEDLKAMVEAMQFIDELVHRPEIKEFYGPLIQPGPGKTGARSRARPTTVITTASAPVRWVRRPIRMAVVDQRLRVHGMQNLWVGDASIMPVVSRANTNLTSIMIGERLADFVQEVA